MRRDNVDIIKIRETILLSTEKVWGITSLKKGCGKTYISKLLAESLDEIEKKVLLISFEHEQKSTEYYILNNLDEAMEHFEQGYTENKVLIADSDKVEGIVLSEKFKSFLSKCKHYYDYVIIDMKAVEETGFTKVLCKICEENIVIISKNVEDGVESGTTIQHLKDCGVSIKGVVLNEYSFKKNILKM